MSSIARFAAAVLGCCLLLAMPAARAAPGDLLPFSATEKTLPNGLKVIVVPTGLPNLVSLQIPVQTGSRNEVEPGKSGFAHFFEHMMFRGTPAFPPARYQALMSSAGVSSNAYTTDDYTNYHATFAADDLETVLMLEADRFQNLAYSEADFKTESRAVLGEYNKSSASPRFKLYEVQRDAAFDRHTYKHTTMGFLKDIEDMPNQYAYSRQFFDRWYRPEHTAIVIAGDVQPARAIALVEKYWSGWKPGSTRAAVPAEPPPHGPVLAHAGWPAATLPLLNVAFHGPAFSDTAHDFAALSTLLELSFGPASALYKRLLQDEQKVDQFGVSVPDRADPNLLTIGARVRRPDDVPAVRDAILQTVAALRRQPVGDRALAEAKSAAKYALAGSLDNTEAIAATLVRFVRYDRSYSTLNRYYRVVDALTPDDLLQAARRWLTDDGLVIATLSNQPLPPAMAALPPRLAPAAGDAAPSAGSAAVAAAAPAFDVLVQRSPLPLIRFKLLFAAGSAHDPAGKAGLAALTGSMVAQAGSSERRIDEVRQALYPLAASFEVQVDKEMTTFTGAVHKDNWDRFVGVAMPLLLSPGFREDDFRRLKQAQANALRVDLKSDNEEEFAKERLQTNVFAGSGYGHPVLGSERAIDALTLDDVKTFHATAYTQGALHAGISGDVSDAMVATLKASLTRLPAGAGLPASALPVGRMPQGLQVEIIEKDTRATAISFGLPIAVTRSHPDFAALTLARSWLGEHRNSSAWLYQRLREERGLNYGDYAYIEAFPRGMFLTLPQPNVARRAQLFEVWIRPVTTHQNAHFALRAALSELDGLVTRGLTEAQFQRTRDFLMKYVYLMTATQDEQLGYALDSQWYGTADYVTTMRSALARLTVADVNAAIRRHLSARNLSVVFITKDAAALRQRLLDDGPSTISYDGEKGPQLLAEDRLIAVRRLGLSAASVTVVPAAAVFAEGP